MRLILAAALIASAVYKEARAFLQRPAAEAVVRAHRALRPHGYGLLIHDGYRPWAITKWHYNYQDWREYPILDIPFSAIGK